MTTVSAPLAYRGRFAPTPSGPLHIGSLCTALASWLDARAAGGTWLLRIDDLDAARCDTRHVDTILRQLECCGLHWDEAPIYQTELCAHYDAALDTLCSNGVVFACHCSRRELRETATSSRWGRVYPGTCRQLLVPHREEAPTGAALRLRVSTTHATLQDDWCGTLQVDWQREIGDMILQRADGIAGYALTGAVDETALGITHVVRGQDLLGSSLFHQHLHGALGTAPPRTRHSPLLVLPDGRKYSKQNHAPAVDGEHATAALLRCAGWLGLPTSDLDAGISASELLTMLIPRWLAIGARPARMDAITVAAGDEGASQGAACL